MDASENNSPSILGNCLGCGGLVRIPSTALADSKVRCPHCAESFPLSQVLEKNAPEMEVVNEHEKVETIPHVDRVASREKTDEVVPDREKFVVPAQLSKGARRRKRHRRRDESSESGSGNLDIDNGGSQSKISSRDQGDGSPNGEEDYRIADDDKSSSRRSSSEGRRRESSGKGLSSRSGSGGRARKKRRERSMESGSGVEFFKIAIGGVLAFPIAYLLVMWIFNQDPLGIGPSIGKVAPFAVPETLQSADGENDETPVADPKGEPEEEEDSLPIPDVDPDKVRANEIN